MWALRGGFRAWQSAGFASETNKIRAQGRYSPLCFSRDELCSCLAKPVSDSICFAVLRAYIFALSLEIFVRPLEFTGKQPALQKGDIAHLKGS